MENIIIMTNKESRRYDIIINLMNNKIDGTQAAKQLNLSVRQVKRIKAKVKKKGIKGVIHGNRGRESNNKINKKEKEKIAKIIEKTYPDFTSQLTHEKLVENHNVTWNYSTTRRLRIEKGLSTVRKRKKNKHFTQRERKESYGELIQFDGSYHDWYEGRCIDNDQCLLLAVDDATGSPIATIGKNESLKEVFKFWKKYIEEYGKPIAIYLDRFSTYKVNHKNADHDKEFKTQFQRALEDELGIKVIFAYSPEAKGRVERMNSTFQDRLVKEMRLVNINNTKDANKFIKKEFIPKFKERFNVKAKKKGNLHTKLTKKEKRNLNSIFSRKTQRIVRNDYTIQYKNRYFQLEEIQQNISVYKKDTVIVEEHLDDNIYINKQGKYLNFKELSGKPKKEIDIKLSALTNQKSNYKPPINHPWRSFKFSKYNQKTKV
jgi:hypothetical protein